MLNPDKYIRKYFSETLTADGLTVFDSRKGTEVNDFYVLLSTQSKNLEHNNKCTKNWDSTIIIEIIQVLPKQGNSGSRVIINDAEEKAVEAYLNAEIEGFNITTKNYSSSDLTTYGTNELINRVILTINFKIYEHTN
jgi:plastocyanin domain-containing protein